MRGCKFAWKKGPSGRVLLCSDVVRHPEGDSGAKSETELELESRLDPEAVLLPCRSKGKITVASGLTQTRLKAFTGKAKSLSSSVSGEGISSAKTGWEMIHSFRRKSGEKENGHLKPVPLQSHWVSFPEACPSMQTAEQAGRTFRVSWA